LAPLGGLKAGASAFAAQPVAIEEIQWSCP
jgi:hypothetical protein